MICGRCEFMSPTDGACRLPSSGRQVVAYFQEACEARNTQNDNDMKGEKKICQECGRELPLEEFARNRWGYTNICKDCMKAKKAGKPIEKATAEVEPYEEPKADLVGLLQLASDNELVTEMRRRGWSGTIVQHNELTI